MALRPFPRNKRSRSCQEAISLDAWISNFREEICSEKALLGLQRETVAQTLETLGQNRMGSFSRVVSEMVIEYLRPHLHHFHRVFYAPEAALFMIDSPSRGCFYCIRRDQVLTQEKFREDDLLIAFSHVAIPPRLPVPQFAQSQVQPPQPQPPPSPDSLVFVSVTITRKVKTPRWEVTCITGEASQVYVAAWRTKPGITQESFGLFVPPPRSPPPTQTPTRQF